MNNNLSWGIISTQARIWFDDVAAAGYTYIIFCVAGDSASGNVKMMPHLMALLLRYAALVGIALFFWYGNHRLVGIVRGSLTSYKLFGFDSETLQPNKHSQRLSGLGPKQVGTLQIQPNV